MVKEEAEKLYKEGQEYFDQGNFPLAIEYCKKATKIDKKYEKAWECLGWAHFRLNDHKSAFKAFKKVKAIERKFEELTKIIGPLNQASDHLLAFSNYESKDYKKAAEFYQLAIAKYDKHYYTWKGLGQSHLKLNNFNEAIKAFQEAINLDEGQEEAWKCMGWAFLKLKNEQKALEAFQKAVELDPKQETTWRGMGLAYSELNQFQKALESFKKAININPKQKANWLGTGWVYIGLKNYKEALESFQKAIDIDPNQERAWQGIGWAFHELKNNEKAKEAFQKALKINPDNDETLRGLGWAYIGLKNYQDAIEVFGKAIEIDPNHDEALRGLGWAFHDSKNYQEAVEAFEKAVKIKPTHIIFNNLGWAYYRLKNFQKALEAFKKAVDIKPLFDDAWNGLGWTYYELGNYQEAINGFNKAIESAPEKSDALYGIGVASRKLKDFKKAIETFEKAIKYNSRNTDYWEALGDTYLETDNYQQATNSYNEGLKIDPDNDEIIKKLEQVKNILNPKILKWFDIAGTSFKFFIKVENTTKYALNDVIIRIKLPNTLEFDEKTEKSSFSLGEILPSAFKSAYYYFRPVTCQKSEINAQVEYINYEGKYQVQIMDPFEMETCFGGISPKEISIQEFNDKFHQEEQRILEIPIRKGISAGEIWKILRENTTLGTITSDETHLQLFGNNLQGQDIGVNSEIIEKEGLTFAKFSVFGEALKNIFGVLCDIMNGVKDLKGDHVVMTDYLEDISNRLMGLYEDYEKRNNEFINLIQEQRKLQDKHTKLLESGDFSESSKIETELETIKNTIKEEAEQQNVVLETLLTQILRNLEKYGDLETKMEELFLEIQNQHKSDWIKIKDTWNEYKQGDIGKRELMKRGLKGIGKKIITIVPSLISV